MNKLFEITLIVKNPYDTFKILHHEIIDGIDEVELCSKIPLMVVNAVRQLNECKERHRIYEDDDIPF